ncbi:similar to Saccharomyces cerevisiae YOL148C SPT20 Subunit of the SAGA transcriptional regulatory complex [Maudiozyma saulgeensis]|uniref:Similar to Saccharomyces cerevisiae YOL148C SPT20 Subunit of the SAGA transcriptional regulatory complex n=1 Tax=Maudiozyma saulgeensis TaxID=1789683 RepID=A0A1X7R212_9SACH|nr:similar to Saccharomyces cerevisiae YOL148C SPT20 Subunit of the SAGA transcriptional regulatory complex [Kazachstania saulgeensis]
MSAVNSPNNDAQNVGIPVNTPGSGLSPQGVAVNLSMNNRNNSNASSNGSFTNNGITHGSPIGSGVTGIHTGLAMTSPINTSGNIPMNVSTGPSQTNSRLTQAQLQLLQQQQQKLQAGTPQQQQQQKQKMIMQQRALQQQRQQQAMHNFETQFYQLLMTINKKPKRLYNFVEDTDSILKKYEKYRPSFEFHIYENNYKICAPANTRVQQQQKSPEISNDGLVLNKNNEILKDFLEYVARGIMPEALMEVLRDCNLQLYEGNIVLQVYDHTNTVDIIPKDLPKESTTSNPQSQGQDSQQIVKPDTQSQSSNTLNSVTNDIKKETPDNNSGNSTSSSERANVVKTSFRRPRVYRTLLRPTDLSSYYDMMTYADQARFSDTIYNQLEAELLVLTKRNIDLNVNLNPYEHQEKISESNFTVPRWDEEMQRIHFPHRKLSTDEKTRGGAGHISQHEELPQHNSTYEQMMLIMGERTTTTTNSAFAAALARHATELKSSKSGSSGSGGSKGISGGGRNTGGSSNSDGGQSSIAAANAAAAASSVTSENNQFSRLKFIEQYRVNKEKRKQQQALNMVNGNGGVNGATLPFNMKISMAMTGSETNGTAQKQKGPGGKKEAGGQAKGKGTNKRGSNSDKPKAKRPRKPKKVPANGETPKKKRVTKKKAAAAAAAAAAAGTVSTPAGNDIGSMTGTPSSIKSTGSPPTVTPK